jgi:MscS family membrane protein
MVKESGTGFAFPTRTLHVGREAGLNEERGKDAETTMDGWRKSGALPFPEFDADLRSEIEDSLDYPPEGSTEYKPPD